MFVHSAKRVAVRAALTDPHSCADGRQPDLLSAIRKPLDIPEHTSTSYLTHSLTHSSTLSLSLSVSHTQKTHRLLCSGFPWILQSNYSPTFHTF